MQVGVRECFGRTEASMPWYLTDLLCLSGKSTVVPFPEMR